MKFQTITRVRALSLIGAAFFYAASSAPSFAQVPEGVDFSGVWQTEKTIQPVGPGVPAPVKSLPGQKGDFTNPILKPWAAAKVKENADLITAGTPQVSSMQLCQPVGIPRLINIPYNFSFLQEKDVITILYEFDHMPRFVYMNEKHPENVKTTWMGHSVGRWEGDTLVIDTIGLNDKTWVDSLATPHSSKMEVTERYRLTDGGKGLELIYTVNDPDTFTTVWSGKTIYSRADVGLYEFVCAENNREQPTANSDGGATEH